MLTKRTSGEQTLSIEILSPRATVEPDRLRLRIGDPIFDDSKALVDRPLLDLVAAAPRLGENLDCEIGCALDVLRADNGPPFIADVDDVRFENLVVRKNDVARCHEDCPIGCSRK